MNSTSKCLSPSFRHVLVTKKQSPIELKEKFRKNYKDKVKSCRNLLMNKFRGIVSEDDVRNTLNEIYKTTFNFPDIITIDEEEQEFMNEIKEELVQEELHWFIEEYEKSQMDSVDWSLMESNNDIICPVCQKINLDYCNDSVLCNFCKWTVTTSKTLLELKNDILNIIENHNNKCNNISEFTCISDTETHIYFMCGVCMDSQMLI